MIDTVFGLFLAHILTDFVFQTDNMADGKARKGWKSGYLYLHVLIAGIMAALLSFQWNIQALWIGSITLFSHYVIDGIKVSVALKWDISGLWPFLCDQIAHILVIVGIVIGLNTHVEWFEIITSEYLTLLLVLSCGVVLLYQPSSVVIQHVFYRWNLNEPKDGQDHLPEAGKWIGYLERTLIFLFVLVDSYSAIGFLIAAKSILRFRESSNKRQITEYILVGTLLSFTAALLIALAVQYLLSYLGVG